MAFKLPSALSDDVRTACVAFLAGKGVPVAVPDSAVSIAQAMLNHMGVGREHPINGEPHALRVIETFYKSRVNPPAVPPVPVTLSKKARRRAKMARKSAQKPPSAKAAKPKTAKPAAKAKSFYCTVEWKRVRYDALKRSTGRCECCGKSPHDGIVLNVDHIKPIRYFPELALELSNLQVLCSDCNRGKGSRDRTDWRKDHRERKTSLDRQYEAIMGPLP